MNKKYNFPVGIFLIILGAAWFIVASFSLKNDTAWLSVLLVSVLSAGTGIRLIDNK